MAVIKNYQIKRQYNKIHENKNLINLNNPIIV